MGKALFDSVTSSKCLLMALRARSRNRLRFQKYKCPARTQAPRCPPPVLRPHHRLRVRCSNDAMQVSLRPQCDAAGGTSSRCPVCLCGLFRHCDCRVNHPLQLRLQPSLACQCAQRAPGFAATAIMGQPTNLVWANVAARRLRARASSFCRPSSGSKSTCTPAQPRRFDIGLKAQFKDSMRTEAAMVRVCCTLESESNAALLQVKTGSRSHPFHHINEPAPC